MVEASDGTCCKGVRVLTAFGTKVIVSGTIMAAFILAGCTKPEPKSSTADKIEIEAADTQTASTQNTGSEAASAEAEPLPELAFFDSYAFDVDLSSALRDGHTKLPVNTRFNINDIPERMDTWFARIIKEGGRVRATPIPKDADFQTRGLISALIDIFVAASEAAEREVIYGPVDEYDALLHFDAESGQVTYVEFVKR